MNQESLRIILKTYSKGGFNEDEAVQLIEDLFNKTYIPYWPQITYGQPTYKHYEYEVNNNENNKVS